MLVKKREENLVRIQLDSTYIVLTQLELCMKKKKTSKMKGGYSPIRNSIHYIESHKVSGHLFTFFHLSGSPELTFGILELSMKK